MKRGAFILSVLALFLTQGLITGGAAGAELLSVAAGIATVFFPSKNS